MWKHGHFYWNELMCRDTEKVRDFYGNTLGWKFNEMQMPDGGSYWIAMDGEDAVAGIFEMSGPEYEGTLDHWYAYIAVDDIDARLKTAADNGATIERPAFDVPGVGRIAMLQDPGGGRVGWMTPAPSQ